MAKRPATPAGQNCTPGVLYELPLTSLTLTIGGGIPVDASLLLSSGRANYILFQDLVARCAGWQRGSEGGDSDLVTADEQTAEVKAFYDRETHPSTAAKFEQVHTAASSTFGPNNNGPKVKRLLAAGDYQAALTLCKETGYDKNAFYVYTNTRGFTSKVPFRYLILPTAVVLANLSLNDPREISRSRLRSLVSGVSQVDPASVRVV